MVTEDDNLTDELSPAHRALDPVLWRHENRRKVEVADTLDRPVDHHPDSLHGGRYQRAVRGNRDKAGLSSAFGWLLRTKKVPGLMVNPCLRGSGVQRNPEKKRERYVTDAECKDGFDVATRTERLLMELTYRTLHWPESDIILWDSRAVSNETAGRFLRFKQNKAGRSMVIALSPALDALIPKAEGNVRRLVEPPVGTLKGGFCTYDGLSSMLKRSIATANIRRKARGLEPMLPFGFRDLKGKGATDMWLAGSRVEDIQALLGHANKTTTEIYIKQRWTDSVQPNMVVMR
jgi:integrase